MGALEPAGQALVPAQERPDTNPARVYLARLGPGSRRAQAGALEAIVDILVQGRASAETMPWHLLGYQHTAAVRARLAARYAPATVNRHLSALRGVLREARRLGLMTAEACEAALDLENEKAATLPAGRNVAQGELRALVQACQDDLGPIGARDAGLLAVLFGAGLRRAELAALDLEHVDLAEGALTVRQGKGRADRITYLQGAGLQALEDWLRVRGRAPGPLFTVVRKGGRVTLDRLTGQSVLDVLVKRARQAGVAVLSPHDARRTWIGELLDAGADIATVQRLAGHARVTTTARYDRRPEAAKRRAAALLHFPYATRASR